VVDANEALQRLRNGNSRFVNGSRIHGDSGESRRRELAEGQEPFAIILGCSDSRVPAEIIFDQGLGDLFVIRVAGNIVQPSQIGSVEFAAANFGTRLVVVLGHTQCGAITATIEQLQSPGNERSANLRSIVEFIKPSVESLLEQGLDAESMISMAIRANVRASAERLRHASPIIEELERDSGLVIVGAEYSLETGTVEFFDGVP
jgi:carbonic anhydrase